MFVEALEARRFLSHTKIAPPAAPTNLSAIPNINSPVIRLAWTNNSSKQSGVIVQAKKGRGAWTTLATLPAQSVYYRAGHLQAAAIYSFRVASFNRSGDSATAAEATALAWAPGEAVVDGSFGVAGDRLTGNLNSASGIAVSPDGATLYLATSTDGVGTSNPILLAMPTTGNATATFGDAGEININEVLPYSMKSIVGVAVQPDGKVLIAGNSGGLNNSPEIARFNADGSLDTAFAGTGEVATNTSNIDEIADGLALTPNGAIYVGGVADSSSELFAASVNSDGTINQSYGDHGLVLGDRQPDPIGYEGYQFYDASVAFDPDDNSAVVAANFAPLDNNGQPGPFTIMGAHLLPDDTFGDYFTYSDSTTTFGPWQSGLTVDSSGKIVVVGNDGNGALALRYNADGTRDTSWAGPGTVVDAKDTGGPSAGFAGIAQLPDHSYVVVGDFTESGDSALIGHLTANGALAAPFTQHKVAGNNHNFYKTVALAPDGSIFAAGRSFQVSTYDSLLATKFSIAT